MIYVDCYFQEGYSRELPNISLSEETKACVDQINRPMRPPMTAPDEQSAFRAGLPIAQTKLSKSVVMQVICKALSGLLKMKGFHGNAFHVCTSYLSFFFMKKKSHFSTDCTESSLNMFVDGIDEFYKNLLEMANEVVINDGMDKHVRNVN